MPVSGMALKECAFFAELPDALLTQTSQLMKIVQLKRREVLLLGDLPFTGLGLVMQGRLQAIDYTIDGREVSLSTIEPGGIFGLAGLLAPRPVELTWVAQSMTTLAVLSQTDALSLLEEPPMGMRLARDLAQQVCDSIGWQKILSVHPISARICSWLLWHFSNRNQADLPTHAELAWRLNTTRESVTRALQRLQAEQVLRREGELWHLVDREALRILTLGEGKAT